MKNYRKALKNSSGKNHRKIRRAKLKAQGRAEFSSHVLNRPTVLKGVKKGEKVSVLKNIKFFNFIDPLQRRIRELVLAKKINRVERLKLDNK